jgi:hypothetical protein
MQELAPYELSPDVVQALIDVAVTSDVLLFGELHGTQEVPRLLVRLLDDLAAVGYRGLALEIPQDERDELERWARGESTTVPAFYAHPFADDRGNRQMLSFVHLVLTSERDWHLLCFDQSPDQPMKQWTERDGWMAHNLREQWHRLCPTAKIVGICGNLHSRLSLPPNRDTTYWPSFAHQLHPDRTVRTVKVRFQTGAYFNMKRRRLGRSGWGLLPFLRKGALGQSVDHSFELLLPIASPATFLASPRQLPVIRRTRS